MKRTILIAEDNEIERSVLVNTLSCSYTILEAVNGAEAEAILDREAGDISVILMDLVMPEIDGFAVLESIRRSDIYAKIPVIVATGLSDEAAIAKAYELGATCVIQKPYNVAVVQNVLANNMNIRERSAYSGKRTTDSLTELYNRDAFLETASNMISEHPAGHYILTCFDVEKFKVINEQYGTEKGDEVLKYIAECIKRCAMFVEGICCRFSEDKFGMLYAASYKNSTIIQDTHRVVGNPPCIDRSIRTRIGRYSVEDITMPVSIMCDKATIAEESIRNRHDVYCVEYDEAMSLSIIHEQEIVAAMRDALRKSEFEINLQPQYNQTTGAIVGAEVLARWNRKDIGEVLMPDEFIPIFERNGFIYELDKYMIAKVCIAQSGRIKNNKKVLPISINISRIDITHQGFIEYMKDIVERYEIPKNLLHIEITESVFATSDGHLINVIQKLDDLGFCVELDDFGRGYSSLNSLLEVPVSNIKIDMRYLKSKNDNERSGIVLESIVRMARWLNIGVIAEGVETKLQSDYLKSIGCRYAQGFYYAKPMSTKEFTSLVDHESIETCRHKTEMIESLNNKAFWNPTSLDTLIFNSYIGGACIFEYNAMANTTELLRANDKFLAEVGLVKDAENNSLLELMNPLMDMDVVNQKVMNDNINNAIATGKESICELSISRYNDIDKKKLIYQTTVRVIASADERYVLYCVMSDITAKKRAEKLLKEVSEQQKQILDTMPGGIGLYEYLPNGNFNVIYLNEGYYSVIGIRRPKDTDKARTNMLDYVHKDDENVLRTEIDAAIEEKRIGDTDIRVMTREDTYVWVNIKVNIISHTDEKTIFCAFYSDIDRLKVSKLQLEKSKALSTEVGHTAGFSIWLFNLDEKKIIRYFIIDIQRDYSLYSGDVPQSVVDKGIIYKNDEKEYIKMYEDLYNGAESSGATIRVMNKTTCRYEWNRYSYTRVHDVETDSRVAIGFSMNVDLEMEDRKRYEHEQYLRREMIADAVAYYQMNLSTGCVEAYHSIYSNLPGAHSGIYVDERIRQAVLNDIAVEDREKVISTIFTKALIHTYENGESLIMVQFRYRVNDEGYIWLQAKGNISKRPDTGELIAFIYFEDIDNAMKERLAKDCIVNEETENLMLLNLKSKNVQIITLGTDNNPSRERTFSYEDGIVKLFYTDVSSADRAVYERFFNIDELIKKLKTNPTCSITYRVKNPDGCLLRKQTRALYLDKSHEDIIFVRRDITDLYKEEQRQKQMLRDAANTAVKANQAKSEFLSHVSHDMRTPLNAVLAFSSSDMTENATKADMHQFLDKINSSGNYLLGIINDVLDMSKIEQSKMVLHPAPYVLKEFVDTMNTVIGMSCKKNGIEFIFKFDQALTSCALVDKVRFNQIFINLLSNAVKFTKPGGRINLTIKDPEGNNKMFRFTVADTGIGMSPEFLPHAFESFSQEYHKEYIDNLQGTGLGLAIVKEIVLMMEGNISVESKPGIGTTFVVELPIVLINDNIITEENNIAEDALKGAHVLLCEDNVINSEIAVRLLTKQGCLIDCAFNGQEGIKCFANSGVGYYDCILMDIKMPVMNGFEATEAIRALKREDASIVPIIALTANAFSEDEQTSLKAGMNAHLTKPFEPDKLYNTINQLINERKG